MHIWDCTAGRFNWHYDVNEVVYFLEGNVTLKDVATGVCSHVGPGDTVLFEVGSIVEWTVTEYVRKFAVIMVPVTRKAVALRNAFRAAKRLLSRGEKQLGGIDVKT
jgi:ethanolamine utilization protein EutQ (cupin superfamily)